MKKIIYLIMITIVIILLIINIGSIKATGEDAKAIKAPTNNSLSIYGKWRVSSIKIFNEELNIFNENIYTNESYIEFTNDKIELINNKYINPSYKLKSVDKTYILSYESNLSIEPFMNGKERVDVITITSNNNMIAEFIITEENKGYIIYMGALIEVERDSESYEKNLDNEIKNDALNDSSVKSYSDIDYYDSEIGLMLGLKEPRVEMEDGTYSTESYRTLWISFKDGKLMPIIEKENILFPRVNGIWSLENKVLETKDSYEEYFEVTSLDGKSISTYEQLGKDIYKNITFIANDYIGVEQYIGENFKNIFIEYGVVPIDNINSNSGLDIEELYSKEINSKYKMEYEKYLDSIYLEGINSNIDYSNFTVKRRDGKWELIGNLGVVNKDGKAIEYPLNIRPNKKMLNYDNLSISWKQLKGEIPFIRDAYISPNDRIAIILFKDNLAIYEIKDKMLKGVPLVNINIGNEEVIMAEWSTGTYVEKWSKVFDDGIYITN